MIQNIPRRPLCPWPRYVRIKPFVQDYKSFFSSLLIVCSINVSISHSSLCQTILTFMPYFTPAGIQLFFSAICQTFAMLMLRFDLFFQVLNLPSLLSLLFFLIRSRFLFLFKTITTSPITKSQENLVLLLMPSALTYQTKKMLVPSLIQHFLFYQINQVSLSNIMASFVKPLNSSHVVKTKTLPFKATCLPYTKIFRTDITGAF